MCALSDYVEHDPSRTDVPNAPDASSPAVLSAPVLVDWEAMAHGYRASRSTRVASELTASPEESMRRQLAQIPTRAHLLCQLPMLYPHKTTTWSSAEGGTTMC